ncbi:MAG: HAD-IA family hydrolase [Candidatus Nanoarchaeia archaeon]|nr:HAD-IA family hydrolase [Candidatus Nanoarchaeia archaeon]
MEIIKNKRQIEGGLFDYGNVLHKFNNWTFINKIGKNKSKEYKDNLYEIIFGSGLYQVIDTNLMPLKSFYNLVTEQAGINKKRVTEKIFLDAFTGRFSRKIKRNINLVKKLKQEKYSLGLISNTNQADYEQVIKKSDVINYFDSLALSYRAGTRKPEKEFFDYAISMIGLPAEKLFFVDDNKKYVDIAEDIGFKFAVQYTPGINLENIIREKLA